MFQESFPAWRRGLWTAAVRAGSPACVWTMSTQCQCWVKTQKVFKLRTFAPVYKYTSVYTMSLEIIVEQWSTKNSCSNHNGSWFDSLVFQMNLVTYSLKNRHAWDLVVAILAALLMFGTHTHTPCLSLPFLFPPSPLLRCSFLYEQVKLHHIETKVSQSKTLNTV